MKLFLAIVAIVALATYADAECRDVYNKCSLFVTHGLCKNNPDYSKKWCMKTCGFCAGPPLPSVVPPGTCGKPLIQGQRVIGGITATRGSWPWQILMLRHGAPGCGGSIVGPRHIVTAAHCVEGAEKYPNIFRIRVGEYNTRIQEGSEVEYNVKQITVHPNYHSPTVMNNDIAILELTSPIRFNKYVQAVCLPDKDVLVGTECYITGWGKVRHPGYMTHILQQAKMPVVSKYQCYNKNTPNIGIHVTDAMICSGDGGTSNKSGCHGDSGGPFVCQVNGRWELHGAVSHGSSRCDSTESYSVYARVAYFKKWIDNVMSQ